jgi:thiol-disulfide isomerase/thioredoxin
VKRLAAALVFVALVVAALVLTRNGGEQESAVPALTVTRMEDERPYELTQLADTDRPTLLWFWAPWCTVCNGEAAKIQRLAEEAGDGYRVVAIGGRDDLANAPAFVERHALNSPLLLFDETMQVWEHYRIPGQPAMLLLDTEGREQERWLGAFDTALAADAARAL